MPASGSMAAQAAAAEAEAAAVATQSPGLAAGRPRPGVGLSVSPSPGGERNGSNERRDRTKPGPRVPTRPLPSARPISLQPTRDVLGVDAPPPEFRSRTNSAPHVDQVTDPLSREPPSAGLARRPADQAAHALARQRQRRSENSVPRTGHGRSAPRTPEATAEINIAVIGAEGVGKSTFIQKAFGAAVTPSSPSPQMNITVRDTTYCVRLLELPSEDIEISPDESISWPRVLQNNRPMPRVDGCLIIYSATDKESIEELPEMMYAINKAALPAVLIAYKCNAPTAQREVDPSIVEQYVKRAIGSIRTVRISNPNSENHLRSIHGLLKSIIKSRPDGSFRSPSRPRAQTIQSGLGAQGSPRLPSEPINAARSSGEYARPDSKDQQHVRHDSSLGSSYSSTERMRSPRKFPDDHRTFLWEESASEASPETGPVHLNDAVTLHELEGDPGMAAAEVGVTFDDLVDRLLAQPTSKADSKFRAVFLCLYRKFAAPGRLFEAIVNRFDAAEHNNSAQMIKTVDQLRYLAVVEQWVGTYPGDFAHPRTKRRLQTFVTKIGVNPIFAVAANEINFDLQAVQEDDDTGWEYTDKEREAIIEQLRKSISSTASNLMDDPAVVFAKQLSGSTLSDDPPVLTPNGAAPRPLPTANQMLTNVESARMQALLLQPIPRHSISKDLWRLLLDQPDELIAREITRMDWLMFLSIRSRDLVRHVSLSAAQKEDCRNLVHVNHMIDHFNQLATWVANFILLRDKPKHRAEMLEKFMRVARKLREMNNYSGLGAILAGVRSTSIHRLTATRDQIPAEVSRDWLKLEILMATSRSHFSYRLAWENSSTERIPYMPLHRRDLAAAEEGNRTFVDDDETRINWKKFEIMGDVIVSIQRAQGTSSPSPGSIPPHEQIKELILDVKLVKDEEDLYERSVHLEPGPSASGASSLKSFFTKR